VYGLSLKTWIVKAKKACLAGMLFAFIIGRSDNKRLTSIRKAAQYGTFYKTKEDEL
jgi:hypothetical protein